MDYKKKYEQALERAKKFCNRELYAECNGTLVEYIFPELEESEDEKVRKWLIDWANTVHWSEQFSVTKEQVLAWLGKQDPKKHEEELERAYKCADEVQYRKGYEDAKKEFEKQGEHKCDCKYVGCHVNGVKRWCHKKQAEILYEKCNIECSEYLKQGEQKPTNKVESKQNWSEEDEKRVESLHGWLDTLVLYIHYDATVPLDLRRDRIQEVERLKTWLKSLKDRYAWKPSEEQIIELHRAISGCSYNIEPLIEIEKHLKKLREE